jgi:LmbE family N-acetylglucosaminyl deacetylase
MATIMAVHAHPDDEATSTGGVLARYAAEGHTTVLVTCTNGEFGDSPRGLKPEDDDHDPDEVVAHRMGELRVSCEILKISHLELLGYRDSGMEGWSHNEHPDSFWAIPVEQSAAKLGTLMDRYKPDVVITYNEYGFYGHPDHIQANRITLAALEQRPEVAKLYYTAIPISRLRAFGEAMEAQGIDNPFTDEERERIGTPDELIGAVIDVSAYALDKFNALAAHASQTESSFFLELGPERFAEAFGTETFVRVRDSTGQTAVESSLLTGLT